MSPPSSRFADERRGQGFRRPAIFAAFTAEEKGLLGLALARRAPDASCAAAGGHAQSGSAPARSIRCTILTTLALDNSARLAKPCAILGVSDGHRGARPTLSRSATCCRRTDHWPFMQRGVPAVSFLFGFDPTDTDAAARYRDWYENRYHAPARRHDHADRFRGARRHSTASISRWRKPSRTRTQRRNGCRTAPTGRASEKTPGAAEPNPICPGLMGRTELV